VLGSRSYSAGVVTMRFSIAALASFLMLGAPLQAQQDSTLLANGTALGGTAGVLLGSGELLATVSLEALALRAHAASGALSLALASNGLFECDAGVAYNVSLPGSTVFLKGGVGAAVKTSNGGPYTYLGVHFGAALLARTAGRTGLLLDFTDHIYPSGGAAFWTIGIGLAALPR
jgi:hypothetical protein